MLKTRYRPTFVGEFVFVKTQEPEVLPPTRLVLPAVQFHHVSEHEPCALGLGAFLRVHRHPRQKAVSELLKGLIKLADRFGGIAFAELRAR